MSWDTLLNILQEGRDLAMEESQRAPEACPICGTVLEAQPESGLYCPFDEHYYWP